MQNSVSSAGPRVGVVVSSDPWRYFREIYTDLQAHFPVSLFQRRHFKAPVFNTRINRYLFHRDLESFLARHEVVFFEWASDLLVLASHLPKKTRIITRLHRYEMFQWAEKVNWENVDRIILVSRAMQEKFASRFPQHAGRTCVIPEAVSTARFQPVQRPFGGDIGTLCFLSPRKRVYELILAFAMLEQEHPIFRLHIAGSGAKNHDYVDALHSLVRRLGLQERVTFYGEVREPWTWYRNIDIFVSNSFSEGLQVAPMEAMASARYTLSHYWDGADDLLPAGQLFLTDAQLHAQLLAYAALTEAEQRALQEQMRQIAVEKFDIAGVQAQIRQLVAEAAQEALPRLES
jgi:glycosyltransferase involved in cell wall biosynthesis